MCLLVKIFGFRLNQLAGDERPAIIGDRSKTSVVMRLQMVIGWDFVKFPARLAYFRYPNGGRK